MTKPALILWGQHDHLAPAPMGEQAIATFPNATALIYENSGHAPFWEEADRFNTDLAAFADQAFRQLNNYRLMPVGSRFECNSRY